MDNKLINIDMPAIEVTTATTIPDKLTARTECFFFATDMINGKLVFKLGFNIVEPSPYDGMKYYETYWVGGNEDKGSDPGSVYPDGKGYKSFCRAKALLGLAHVWNTTELAAKIKAVKPQVVITFVEKAEPATRYDGSPNARAGQVVNSIGTMHAVGDKPLGLAASTQAAKPAALKSASTISTMPCGLCGQQVPTTEFAAHMKACRAAAAAAKAAATE